MLDGRLLATGVAVLLAWGGLTAAPAQAADDAYTAITAHTSAADPADDTTDSWSGADVHLNGDGSSLDVWAYPTDGPAISIGFAPPKGAATTVGTTYRTQSWHWTDEPNPLTAQMTVFRAGRMCGKTSDEQPRGTSATSGSFTVQELERGTDGRVTRLRATWELNCQALGGPRGTEGTIAFDATAPAAPVPTVVSPGPVTGLRATNVGPDSGGTNATTLSWTKPVGASDVVVDMVQFTDATKFPALVGVPGVVQYAGRASSYRDDHVEFMDTRTYRVTPRTANGRLGEPTNLVVLGSRLTIPRSTQRIQVGEDTAFSGRLSESWDYVDPADVMKGPGIVGQRVLFCRQSSNHYVEGACDLVAATTTTADGSFTFRVKPVQNSWYAVRVPATPGVIGNFSYVISSALVSPQTDLAAPEGEAATARAGAVRRGSVIHFTTSRARTGSSGTVRLQRLDGRTWRTLVTKRIPTSGPRRMGMSYREWSTGSHSYRVTKSPDSRHVTGFSKVVRVRVS